MLTGYPLSCTLGRSVLGIGSGAARFLMIAVLGIGSRAARFLMIAEYYLQILAMCCECNAFAQSTVRFIISFV